MGGDWDGYTDRSAVGALRITTGEALHLATINFITNQ
jgi:hypothetical protein